MPDLTDPKSTGKPNVRGTECDREMEHYDPFVSATNETNVVCWECG